MLDPFDAADPFGAPEPAHLAIAGFEPGHVGQFYENDASLPGIIVDFIAAGLVAGQPAVVIATLPHGEAVTAGLRGRWIDVNGLLASGRLTMLDARETLASFMTGTMPNAALFKQVVGGLISNRRPQGSRLCVRAYGEMVDLLWKDGNAEGAIELEKRYDCIGSDPARRWPSRSRF